MTSKSKIAAVVAFIVPAIAGCVFVNSKMNHTNATRELFDSLRESRTPETQLAAITAIYKYQKTCYWSPLISLNTCNENGGTWSSGDMYGIALPEKALARDSFVFKLLAPGAMNAINHINVK